jgi:hypothetical protein
MNWIIQSTKKLKFHTNFEVLLKPIEDELSNLIWLTSDLEINTDKMSDLPINHSKDWFIITQDEMEKIRKLDTQIVWGVFSAFDKSKKVDIDEQDLPFAEGNSKIWENNYFQNDITKIEIIAWDSSYTIVKFKDETLSDKFKEYFDEAIPLEKFKKQQQI